MRTISRHLNLLRSPFIATDAPRTAPGTRPDTNGDKIIEKLLLIGYLVLLAGNLFEGV